MAHFDQRPSSSTLKIKFDFQMGIFLVLRWQLPVRAMLSLPGPVLEGQRSHQSQLHCLKQTSNRLGSQMGKSSEKDLAKQHLCNAEKSYFKSCAFFSLPPLSLFLPALESMK